jgi:hypothetical protein
VNPFAHVSGARAQRVRLTVPARGVWVAEVQLENDETRSGSVELHLGALVARGVVDASDSGVVGGVSTLRIVGGAGAWGRVAAPKHYHNDLGVKASLVAQDAAREAGETLGAFVPRAERVGKDYARQSLPLARALEDAAGGADWWVGLDGVTQVGTRATSTPDPAKYEVMAYDPDGRRVTLAVDSPDLVPIGAILSKNLPEALTVRELQIEASAEDLRVVAWCGQGPGALQNAFRALVARLTDGKLFGAYRYRVTRVVGDRVELQAVRKAAGLPNTLPLSMWPGVAGSHATLAPGAEVLVQFLEGDRTQPVVTAFAGADGQGFVPLLLELGGKGGPFAARQGDAVQVTLPPASFEGTIGGSPATGTVTWVPPATANGTITGGSTKVRIGS